MAIFLFFSTVLLTSWSKHYGPGNSRTEKVFDLIEEALVMTICIMDSGVQKKLFVSTFNCHTAYVRMCRSISLYVFGKSVRFQQNGHRLLNEMICIYV